MKRLVTEISAPLELVVDAGDSPGLDEAALGGILEDYRRFDMSGGQAGNTLWATHEARAQRELRTILQTGAPAQLGEHLATLHRQPTLRGYDQHGRITEKLDADAAHRAYMARLIYATLIQLAAGLGVLRAFNPENSGNYPYLAENLSVPIGGDALAALGVHAPLPHSGAGAYGLDTGQGILTHRHAIGLGYLREIRAMLSTCGRDYRQIVEIGGGLGRTSLHLARDLGHAVTIIDLPVVSVTQHAFLMANGVVSTLWTASDHVPHPGEVRLLNAGGRLAPDSFRDCLFVNFDSFVEMDRDSRNRYFKLISDSGGDLLSINQEAASPMTPAGDLQNWRTEDIAELGLRAGPRMMFWERDGYVVQWFMRSGSGRVSAG